MDDADAHDHTDRLCELVLAKHRAQRDLAYRRLWQAVMLSPSIGVREALLRGEPVPRSQLDPEWARRFGL